MGTATSRTPVPQVHRNGKAFLGLRRNVEVSFLLPDVYSPDVALLQRPHTETS